VSALRACARGLASRLAALACAAAVAAGAAAQTEPTAQPAPIGRPRIGVVLSGGGARGLTHIGVLKVLEDMRIPVDYITATSMGSIVGGLYAAGYDARALEAEVKKIDWKSMFSDSPPRQDLTLRRKEYDERYSLPFELGYRDGKVQVFKGAIAGANLELWLHAMTQRDDALPSFDELSIPFRAVATDMVSGRQVVFRSGPLYQAMRASMSVPGLFAPLELDGRIYGDGGLVNNLPVDVVQAMGADVVIAVNIGTPLMTKEQLSSIVGFASQSLNILTEQNVREQLAKLGTHDVLIEPDLGDLTFLDFDKATRLIELGEAAARAAAPRLAALALTPTQYASWQATRHRPPPVVTANIADVKVTGTSIVNPQSIKDALANLVGKPFDDAHVTSDLATLYGTGDFDRISYRLTDIRGGEHGIDIDVSENSLGPNYLRLGGDFSSDLQGDTSLNLIGGVKRRWLNAWGAEWTNDFQLGTVRSFATELYQPLGVASPLFVSAYGGVRRAPVDVFDGDDRVATYSLLYEPVGIDFGYAASRYGEVRLGYRFAHYRADLDVGTNQGLSTFRIDENGAALLARYDRLDDPYFPRSGFKGTFEVFSGQQRVGAGGATDSHSVTRARGDFLQALPLTPTAQIQVAGRLAWESAFDIALTDDYQLGGFLNLSGLRNDQLAGQYLAFARVVYTQRVGSLSVIGRGIYLGGSLEAGNAWAERGDVGFGNLRKAGSLFVGLDTYLGPFYFAYGRASGGASSFYVFLGRP
jgi:NTE family protein